MTRDTFIGGEGSRFLHGDKHGRSFYLPPNSASNATFLTTLRYLLIQDWDLDDDGQPETLRLLYGAPGRWLARRHVLEGRGGAPRLRPGVRSGPSRIWAGARWSVDGRAAWPHRPKTSSLVRLPLPAGRKTSSARAERHRPAGLGPTARLSCEPRGTVWWSASASSW